MLSAVSEVSRAQSVVITGALGRHAKGLPHGRQERRIAGGRGVGSAACWLNPLIAAALRLVAVAGIAGRGRDRIVHRHHDGLSVRTAAGVGHGGGNVIHAGRGVGVLATQSADQRRGAGPGSTIMAVPVSGVLPSPQSIW